MIRGVPESNLPPRLVARIELAGCRAEFHTVRHFLRETPDDVDLQTALEIAKINIVNAEKDLRRVEARINP